MRATVILAAGALAAACTEPAFPALEPSGYVITIRHDAFVPAQLTVPPGATIEIRNEDAAPHSVTSEAAPGLFEPAASGGVVLDTGVFEDALRVVAIPAGAAPGTVVHFYCRVVRGGMAPPDGSITVGTPR